MTEPVLPITRIGLKSHGGYAELGALVDGDYVYIRVPGRYQLRCTAEFFVGVALLEAMYTARTIVLPDDVPVSAQLMDRFDSIQSVYACWNRDLRVITLRSRTAASVPGIQGATGSLFSGGVDSTHTLMRHFDDVSHLLMLNCFDDDNGPEAWSKRVVSTGSQARNLGKQLLPIETNARDWTDKRRISWEFAHGLVLCTVGHTLGLSRVYIPSSHSYDQLFPWGTHPLTDPMWSTECCDVAHDGAASSRGEKVRELIEGGFTDHLQVCWRASGGNCGQCSKCVRTMVAAHLLGAEIKTLPAFGGLHTLKQMRATDEGLASQLEDTMRLAAEVGNEAVYMALFRLYRRYRLSAMLAELDRYLLGAAVKRLYRRLRKPQWLNARVTLTGDRALEGRLQRRDS